MCIYVGGIWKKEKRIWTRHPNGRKVTDTLLDDGESQLGDWGLRLHKHKRIFERSLPNPADLRSNSSARVTNMTLDIGSFLLPWTAPEPEPGPAGIHPAIGLSNFAHKPPSSSFPIPEANRPPSRHVGNWWTHHLHAYLQSTILPLPFAPVQPASHGDLWQGQSHCKEHAIQALFASSEWTRPNHTRAWGDNAPNIHQAFGWLDESRKIFAERPHREFLNSDHLGDHYSAIWASPALFGIVCAFSHIIMKRQLIYRSASATKRLLAFFLLVLVPFPNTNKRGVIKSWEMEIPTGSLMIRYLRLNRVAPLSFVSRPFFFLFNTQGINLFLHLSFYMSTQLPPHEQCIVFRFQTLSPLLLQSASTIPLPIIKRIERPHWTSSHSRYRSQNTSDQLTTIFPVPAFPESN